MLNARGVAGAALAAARSGIAPDLCKTASQTNRFPEALRRQITIRHDGIDTSFFRPVATPADDPDCPAHPCAMIAIAGAPSVFYGTDRMRRVDWLVREGRATPGFDRSLWADVARPDRRSSARRRDP